MPDLDKNCDRRISKLPNWQKNCRHLSVKKIPTQKTSRALALDNPQRAKALVIDDESDIYYLLTGILAQMNIQALFAPNLTAANKFAQPPEEFAYIFLDNHLPDGEGISHIHHFKNRFPGASVVLISGQDDSASRKTAITEGADYF